MCPEQFYRLFDCRVTMPAPMKAKKAAKKEHVPTIDEAMIAVMTADTPNDEAKATTTTKATKARKATKKVKAPIIAMKAMKATGATKAIVAMKAMKAMKVKDAMKGGGGSNAADLDPFYRGVVHGLFLANRQDLAFSLDPADARDPFPDFR